MFPRPAAGESAAQSPRACPWCGGPLVLEPRYPRRSLIPGACGVTSDDHIPETFRTVRAWLCATPHCRFRESA